MGTATSPRSHGFGLTIDMEELINKIDTDGSGEIEFDEFSLMLGK